jgi:hypothetical protein
MKTKINKIVKELKRRGVEGNTFFQPDNYQLNVLCVYNYEHRLEVVWVSKYGVSTQLTNTDLESEIEGRFLEVE